MESPDGGTIVFHIDPGGRFTARICSRCLDADVNIRVSLSEDHQLHLTVQSGDQTLANLTLTRGPSGDD